MPQWVRPLDQSTKGAAEWHVSRIKSYATTTYCGRIIPGTLEITSDDNAEREGRCKQCLAISTGATPQKQTPPVKKAAAKSNAAKDTLRKGRPRAQKRR
jgi:hypothetical protein